MSHITERGLLQDATLWSRTGSDGFGGDAVGSATAIKCRWIDVNEMFRNPVDKTEVVSQSVVYADRDLKVGDWLFLGTTTEANPAVAGAIRVRGFSKIPNLRNLTIQRKAFL